MDSDQAGGIPERRTGNRDLELVIDHAISLLQTDGETEARRYLASHQVPDHITLRVMACAAFRRRCRTSTHSGGGHNSSLVHPTSLSPPSSPAAMPRHLRRGSF